MKIYLDCDGVILDSETNLFIDYNKERDGSKSKYLESFDWFSYLENVKDINDALYFLKSFNYDKFDILTRVHSLNEARAKIAYFRNKKVKNNIIVVPSKIKKCDVVRAKDNILVDNNIYELKDWVEENGYGIYFGEEECEYVSINSLDKLLSRKLIKSLKK